jgi:hypothetical protein
VTCAALVACVAALYAARYWLTWDRFLGGHRDEVLWLPLAMRANDGALFAADPLVPALGRFFPRAWVALAAAGLDLTPDPGTFTLLASTLLVIVYAVGMCALGLIVSGSGVAAVVVGAASLRPNLDLSGVGWGVLVGNAEPRAFVYAVAPWIIAAFLVCPRTPRSLALLGVALGGLGNLHPPSAVHLGALVAGALVLASPSAAGLGRALALLGGGLLGVLPYAVQWLRAFEPGPMPLEIIAFRSGAEIAPAGSDLVVRLLGSFLVPLGLAVLALRVDPADDVRGARRADLVRLAVVAVIGLSSAPIVPLVAPRFFALAPLRLSGYLYLVALVLAGELIRRLLAPRPERRILRSAGGHRLAAALLAALLVVTAGGGRVGDLARAVQFPRRSAATLWTDVSPAGGVPRDEFLELCRWAGTHTRRSDLFLAPTSGWASFRVYAARPLFVSFKDGSVVTYALPRQAAEWYRRLRAVDALYAAFHADAVSSFARAHAIAYVVQERARPAVDLPIAYENAAYRVYATGD